MNYSADEQGLISEGLIYTGIYTGMIYTGLISGLYWPILLPILQPILAVACHGRPTLG
jgi:hypothetical protein